MHTFSKAFHNSFNFKIHTNFQILRKFSFYSLISIQLYKRTGQLFSFEHFNTEQVVSIYRYLGEALLTCLSALTVPMATANFEMLVFS